MKRLQVHRTIYVTLLCLLVMALPTSNFVMNMAWVFLGVNWLVEGDFRRKFSPFRTQYLLHAFLVLMAVHLLWLISSANLAYGLDDIRRKLPLLVVPLVVLTSQPLQRREQHGLLLCYLATLTVVSVVGWVRYATIPNLPYREAVPYISHIRFSLNLCLASVLLFYAVLRYRKSPYFRWLLLAAVLLWALYAYMLVAVLRSYTAIAVLMVLTVVLPCVYWQRITVWLRWMMVGLCVIVAGAGMFFLHSVKQEYYAPCTLLQQRRVAVTVNGNAYTFADDGLMENGNYISNYVCERELRSTWPMVSRVPIDSLQPNGYALYHTLVRYLNARGLPKDSVAVCSLTPGDVAAIERGVANPHYEEEGFLRCSIYALLFERDNARLFGNLRNFSLGERRELWRCGAQLFLLHPLLGVGTGDGVDALHAYMVASQSQLRDTTKHVHNQYLSFLISFGLLGTGLILFFFLRAWRHGHPKRCLLQVTMVTITLVSFLSEDTLETLAGVLFVVTFISLFSQCTIHTSSPTVSR